MIRGSLLILFLVIDGFLLLIRYFCFSDQQGNIMFYKIRQLILNKGKELSKLKCNVITLLH